VSETTTPPPNPFYRREYATSIAGGQAWVSIPFPGGKIVPQDAEDVVCLLRLIVSQLERKIREGNEAEHVNEPQEPRP
jgi:hypothetical protein